MQAHGGAADCFHFPDNCKSVKAAIDSQLQNITISDLKFLESVKYTITAMGGMFYNTGVESATSWDLDKPDVIMVGIVSITDKEYLYDFILHDIEDDIEMNYVGHSTNSGMEYLGTLCSELDSSGHWKQCWTGYSEIKLISPFFFEAFNITEWCD